MAMESYKREQQALQQQQQQQEQQLQMLQLSAAIVSQATSVVTTSASNAASFIPGAQVPGLSTDDAAANASQTGDDNVSPSMIPVQMMIKPGVSRIICYNLKLHLLLFKKKKKSFFSVHQLYFHNSKNS